MAHQKYPIIKTLRRKRETSGARVSSCLSLSFLIASRVPKSANIVGPTPPAFFHGHFATDILLAAEVLRAHFISLFFQSHFSPECRVLNSSCRRPWRACRGRRWTQSWRHSIDFRWISRSRSRLVCKTKEERAPKSKRVRSHERDPKHRTRTVGWINKIKKNVSAVGSDARRKTKG